MILIVQSNVPGRLFVSLVQSGKKIQVLSQAITHHGSEKLLALVDRLLTQAKIKPQSLSGIGVVRGPGRFSAVRSGLIVANTLADSLEISAVGVVAEHALQEQEKITLAQQVLKTKKPGIVKPWYGSEPNITVSKIKL